MRETATILQGFSYYAPQYRPFDELEVPGVSVLVASAAAAGYYPIAEYKITKVDRRDRRTRRVGRADLWFIAGECSFSFEFKRAWNVSTETQLMRCIEAAEEDASEIPLGECDYAFGAVIAPVIDTACIETYESFRGADYAFSLGDEKCAHVFLYFKRHER